MEELKLSPINTNNEQQHEVHNFAMNKDCWDIDQDMFFGRILS